jgi:hypothetical protein
MKQQPLNKEFLRMQKIAGLITESEFKQKSFLLLEEEKLSPKEKEIIDDILNSLNEGAFDNMIEKIKSYAKKGLMTTAVLASLLSAPNLSAAQQTQIKQAAQIEMTSQQTDDLTLGTNIIKAYEKNPEKAEQWFKINKHTAVVDNIKSVIKKGKDQQDIKDLGSLYQGNPVAQEFIKALL